ncbi:g1446 [Coccomyxa elongata]
MAKKRKRAQTSQPAAKPQKKQKETGADAKGRNQAVPLLDHSPQHQNGFSSALRQQAQRIVRGTVAQAGQPEDLVALHRVRFVPWQPTAAIASAATADGSLLAVARENGSIELWETATWTCFQRLPGREEASVSCMAWAQDPVDGSERLFTGGLDGALTEWDLRTRRPRHVGDSFGGAVWAMAAEPRGQMKEGDAPRVAVACDDGVLRVFTAEGLSPGLAYHRSMPALGSRLLSVAWHPSGQSVLVGTAISTMHAWHLASSRELMRINIGDGSGAEQCAWAVLVLPDGTMVSGDAAGGVQFWDARLGTRLASFHKHAADVLTLAAAPEGNAVFASGVDNQLAAFKLVTGQKGKPERWVFTESRRPHSHDVRTLTVASIPGRDPVLISAGNDAQILVHSVPRFSQEHPVRVCKCPQPPLLAHASGGSPPHLLSAQGTQVDLWRLGVAHDRQQHAASVSGWAWAEGAPVDVGQEPRHLARIAAKGPAHVAAAAMSADGAAIAFCQADPESVRLFRLAVAPGSDAVALSRQSLPDKLPTAAALAFTSDGSRLLMATPEARVVVVDLEEKQVAATFSEAAQQEEVAGWAPGPATASGRTAAARLASVVTQLLVSPDNRWAALVTPRLTHLYDLAAMKYHGRLPVFEEGGVVTAAAFGPSGDVIALATAGNHVALFEAATLRHTPWSLANTARPPQRLLQMPGSVCGISFCPDPQVKSAVLHTASSLCHVDFEAPPAPAAPKRRRRSRQPQPDLARTPGANFRVLPLENPCLLCTYTSTNAALLVEKAWTEIMKTFPPPLYRHRYGT